MQGLCNEVNVGVDIGSTTAKIVVCDENEVLFKKYERHYSQVRQKTLELLKEAQPILKGKKIKIAISGSAGMGVAEISRIQFILCGRHITTRSSR